jgi:hypothetical protein
MGVTTKKYGVFVSCCLKLFDFRQNRRLTPTDFERKFEFFKSHKNSYTGPLHITDP